MKVKPRGTFSHLTVLLLRAMLVAALLVSGWLIYSKLPNRTKSDPRASRSETQLQIMLRSPGIDGSLDIPVELYPVDIVAVRHEYFTERRAGKRFDDFLNERMQGRRPVNARLDKDGQATIALTSGNWWLNAVLPGDEDLEWRLPLNVAGSKQIVELTSQNVYTRTKSF
jgi:hypothetical protein